MKRTARAAVIVAVMMAAAAASAASTRAAASQGTTKAGASKPAEQVETVAVGGCLKEGPADTWTLATASEPVASTANAPSPKELADLPQSGTSEFRLIGVGIFNLPSHRNHTLLVKGLLVKAA